MRATHRQPERLGSVDIATTLTVPAQVEVERGRDGNVDDAEEALVLLFELLLIKDLYRDDARVFDVDIE